MIFLALLVLLLFSGLFILLPMVKGDSLEFDTSSTNEKKSELLEHWQDKRESLKLSLRDLDLEQRIGKIDGKDFAVLKEELLAEWAHAEEELKKLNDAG